MPPDLAADTSTVVTFYAASLQEVVGPSYKSPSLQVLAKHWLQSTGKLSELTTTPYVLIFLPVSEVRTSSRLLFDAGVGRMSDLETAEMVEYWLPYRECVDKPLYTVSDESLHQCPACKRNRTGAHCVVRWPCTYAGLLQLRNMHFFSQGL